MEEAGPTEYLRRKMYLLHNLSTASEPQSLTNFLKAFRLSSHTIFFLSVSLEHSLLFSRATSQAGLLLSSQLCRKSHLYIHSRSSHQLGVTIRPAQSSLSQTSTINNNGWS